MDTLTKSERSRQMARVPSEHTTPELAVRRLVHSLGYRFRLNDRSLPGSPDLVLRRWRAVIFVHGCFWHQHRCRRGKRMPSTNTAYWERKLSGNKSRDARVRRRLRRLGWRVLAVWECQTKPSRQEELAERIVRFLEGE
jgi:DNA mismatch endonuclease (patch repair protein)